MKFLFSRSQKQEDLIEGDEEAVRARIQAAIDRAIQLPEVEIAEQHEAEPFAVQEEVNAA